MNVHFWAINSLMNNDDHINMERIFSFSPTRLAMDLEIFCNGV